MEPEKAVQPVATVTGLYRGKFGGLEPLTPDKPLTPEEVRSNPIFYELDLHPVLGDENLIIDVIYDNLAPIRLQDLYRGTDIPRNIRFWPDWFDIPPYEEMHDIDGRRVYPRARGSTRSRSGPVGGSGPRWAGSGISALRTAATRARPSSSRSPRAEPPMSDGSTARTFWSGVLFAIGAFDLAALSDIEKADIAGRRTWFWLGEVAMAGVLAALIAIPAGIWFAGRTEISLAFIGAAVLFLPLFVFLPKLIRLGMRADTDAAIDTFGKNEQVKKVFWALFVAMAGLVLARVLDPVTAQQIVGIISAAVP